ncbi:MAG TPA: GNAT family N-acetyltransferase [Streptosporangiaceae bacterium]|nr:GNAT family N-acetyltransferase [Streptosporangiaceae bacterium]
MISADELEWRAAGTWRAPRFERMGEWLLRAADGFTGRANSALAAGDPRRPLPEAVDAVRAWYAGRGQPAMIAVPFPMAGPAGELDGMLDAGGWSRREGPAIVMTAPPGAIAALEPGPGASVLAPVRVSGEPDADWLGMYHYRGQQLPPMARRLLMSAPWQAFASVREDGETIAIGRVAADAGWAGITAIETDPRHRRRGLATAVTAALATLAVEQGATGLYLQVEDGNAAARTLYERMGFTGHHRYHYRIAP